MKKSAASNQYIMPLSQIGAMPAVASGQPRLVHITNPFTKGAAKAPDENQMNTLNAMGVAKQRASVDVSLLFAVEEADRHLSFDFGDTVYCIRRHVCDLASFKIERRLPLLWDILDAALARVESDDDYIIYTNVDIVTVPYFYDAVAEIISKGIDAFSINRRTVSKLWETKEYSFLSVSEVGITHPGSDCFVCKAEYLRSAVRTEACLGIVNIAKSFLYNAAALSPRFVIIPNAHLTCHFGDDRGWVDQEFAEYSEHNKACAIHVAGELCKKDDLYRDRLMQFAGDRKDRVLLDFFNPPSLAVRMKRKLVRQVKTMCGLK